MGIQTRGLFSATIALKDDRLEKKPMQFFSEKMNSKTEKVCSHELFLNDHRFTYFIRNWCVLKNLPPPK